MSAGPSATPGTVFVQIDRTQILILNYNGRGLLEECLPSVVVAARHSPVPCPVSVIDNHSTDDSIAYLREVWPQVRVHHAPNLGLVSFNHVLDRCDEPAVVLLNNDVKLATHALAPLLRTIEAHDDALFAAPQCWTFDGRLYEGMRTRVRSRYGFVQGLARVPGHEGVIERGDLTASAGPVLAVDRRKFLAVGGFDPLYLPGRLEDLDLGFRGWMAGWCGYYVPESIAYHRGMGSFGPAFGRAGCDRLAVRNTFLFCWKNLGGARLASHLAWTLPRLGMAAVRGRMGALAAAAGAVARLGRVIAARRALDVGRGDWVARQEAFFRQFEF